MARRHQNRAGVAAFTLHVDAQRRRSSDRRDNAQRNAASLQKRTLLDVQFHEGVVAAGTERHRSERAVETGCLTQLVEARAILVEKLGCAVGIQSAREQSAPQAADSETCRFFGSEEDQLDRSSR